MKGKFYRIAVYSFEMKKHHLGMKRATIRGGLAALKEK
jgi:hypothetical protein